MRHKILSALLLMFVFTNAMSQTQSVAMQNTNETPDGVVVEMTTSLGDVEILLYNDTPLHRDNFLKLVKEGSYDGSYFHRVIDQFMVQCGDVNNKEQATAGTGDIGYTVPAEFVYPKHFHKYGAVAAARQGDQVNPERASSGSQFYIVTGRVMNDQSLKAIDDRIAREKLQSRFRELTRQNKGKIDSLLAANDTVGLENFRQEIIRQTESSVNLDPMPENIREAYKTVGGTPHLDGTYTVFGEVLKGMDVVEKIQKVETDAMDRPKEPVKIIKITIK